MSRAHDSQKTAPRWWLLILTGGLFFGAGMLVDDFFGGTDPQGDESAGEDAKQQKPSPAEGRSDSFLPDRRELASTFESGADEETDARPGGGLADALRIPIGALREAALLQEGFSLAKADPADALGRLELIERREDRDAYLRGVFAYAASVQKLGEVFQLAKGLEDADRNAALFATLDTLTGGNVETRERADRFTERFGVEAGVGLALSLDPVFRPEFASDWIAVFGDSDSAGVTIGSFASLQAGENFEEALAMGAHLTDWDREMFFRAFGDGWSQKDPAAAWEWARKHSAESGPGGDPILAAILRNWGRKDFAAAEEAFDQMTDPAQRQLGADSLARVQTWDAGTAEAVQWANQLPSEAEKDAAHAAIAEFSPQGIGVALELEDGFTVINRVVPESVAARDGRLQQGDRIVEVDPGTGRFQPLYGRDLSQAVNLIRGESGSRLRLRVIRQDENGALRDRVVELTREQLVLEGS